jgi:hypothetical protein
MINQMNNEQSRDTTRNGVTLLSLSNGDGFMSLVRTASSTVKQVQSFLITHHQSSDPALSPLKALTPSLTFHCNSNSATR